MAIAWQSRRGSLPCSMLCDIAAPLVPSPCALGRASAILRLRRLPAAKLTLRIAGAAPRLHRWALHSRITSCPKPAADRAARRTRSISMNKGRSIVRRPSGHDRGRVRGCHAHHACWLLQGLAWGPVQFRISEAVCVLAVLTPAAVPGLTVGLHRGEPYGARHQRNGGAGHAGRGVRQPGHVPWARCGAGKCASVRSSRCSGRVIANALIVPAYLPLLLQGLGYYTIPFTCYRARRCCTCPCTCSAWWPPVIGEALVIYVLGLAAALRAQALRRGEEGSSPLAGRQAQERVSRACSLSTHDQIARLR